MASQNRKCVLASVVFFYLKCFNLPALDSNIHLLNFNHAKGVQNQQFSNAHHKQVQKEPAHPLVLPVQARPKHASDDSPMTFTLSDHRVPSSGCDVLVTSLYCCSMMPADPAKY